MNHYKELGKRYFKFRKKRAALVMTSMVFATIFLYVAATFAVNYYKNGLATQKGYADYQGVVYFPTAEQHEKIAKHVNVAQAERALVQYNVEFDGYYGWEAFQMIYVEKPEQKTFGYNIDEGRFPQNSSEVMINSYASHMFEKTVSLGDKITISDIDEETQERYVVKEYTIVGFYTRDNENDMNRYYSAFTIAEQDMPLDTYVCFHEATVWRTAIRNMLKDVGIKLDANPATHNVNFELGLYYGQVTEFMSVILALILGVTMLLVYLCTVMVRSLFSTNMIDKMRDFSILKSMGATNKQLKKIFKTECYAEGAIAFVIGVVLSHLLIQVGFIEIAKIYTLKFDFSLVALIVSALLMWATISLAVLEPFGLLKKVSIVEGVGENYTLKSVKMKKRKSRIWKLLGVEGDYAYKNIRRNSRSFWGAVASFTISVLLITALATVLKNVSAMVGIEMSDFSSGEPTFDIYCMYTSTDMGEDIYKKAEELFESKEYITDYYPACNYLNIFAEDEFPLQLSEDVIAKLSSESNLRTQNRIVDIKIYTREELELLNPYMADGVDAVEALKDGGIILVNQSNEYNEKTEKFEDVLLYDLKVGDTISLTKMSYVHDKIEKNQGDMSNIAIAKDSLEDPTSRGAEEIKGLASQTLTTTNLLAPTVIMSYDYLVREYGKEFANVFCGGYHVNINDKTFDQHDFVTTVYQEAKFSEWMFYDMERMVNAETRGVKIVIYVIVVFCILMGIVSVLHSMINEQLARRKEVSLLRAIGMSKKKLNKMLILEKLIVGITAWVIGTLLGVGLSALFIIPMMYMAEMKFVFAWDMYLITLVGLLVVMLLLSWVMINSMGKMNLTDSIRNNE